MGIVENVSLRISIDSGNAAFVEDPMDEVLRILDEAKANIERHQGSDLSDPLLDLNGNSVGHITFTIERGSPVWFKLTNVHGDTLIDEGEVGDKWDDEEEAAINLLDIIIEELEEEVSDAEDEDDEDAIEDLKDLIFDAGRYQREIKGGDMEITVDWSIEVGDYQIERYT